MPPPPWLLVIFEVAWVTALLILIGGLVALWGWVFWQLYRLLVDFWRSYR